MSVAGQWPPFHRENSADAVGYRQQTRELYFASLILSNRHKMSNFEDSGLDDVDLLRVACAPESTMPGKACGELGLSE